MERLTYLRQCQKDNFIDIKSRRIFPVAEFNNKLIMKYIDYYKLMKPIDLGKKDMNGVDLEPKTLQFLKQKYPDDFKKIIEIFPYAAFLGES